MISINRQVEHVWRLVASLSTSVRMVGSFLFLVSSPTQGFEYTNFSANLNLHKQPFCQK